MKTVEISGVKVPIRSIKRKERIEYNLEQHGWYSTAYSPPARRTDGDEIETVSDYAKRLEEGQDIIRSIVLDKDIIDQLDESGGQRALNDAWLEIIKETYGVKAEEKNSPPSGNGSQTENE